MRLDLTFFFNKKKSGFLLQFHLFLFVCFFLFGPGRMLMFLLTAGPQEETNKQTKTTTLLLVRMELFFPLYFLFFVFNIAAVIGRQLY